MSGSGKTVVSRTRHKVRIVNFNETFAEGFVFVAYGQRISDLMNDERGFLPIETDAGEVKVISKRAIMEIELLSSEGADRPSDSDTVVALLSNNAFNVLGAEASADDATIRALYLDKVRSVDPEIIAGVTDNKDLLQAAEALRKRYDSAYDSITNSRQIEAIAEAIKAAQPKRRRFGAA